MKIQLKIEHKEHGEIELVTRPADLMKWERMTGRKLTDLAKRKGDEIEVSIGIEDLIAMAFAVVSRQGLTQLKFDAWSNDLDSIEMMETDETANPPQPGA
jgi:hypothetical protein